MINEKELFNKRVRVMYINGIGGYLIVAYASNYLGTPYIWGGTTPAGFDCSGYTQFVLEMVRKYIRHGQEMLLKYLHMIERITLRQEGL